MNYRVFLFTAIILICSCKNSEVKKPNELETSTKVKSSNVAQSRFVDLNENQISLGDYKGKRVLLNYWATWCRPCIEEMPSLLKAQAALKSDDYVFLLVSDQSIAKIKAFKEKRNFDFTYLKFNGSLAQEQISALPVTFVYNRAGEMTERIDGATDWDATEVIERLRAVE